MPVEPAAPPTPGSTTGAASPPVISVQLYSVRDHLGDLDAVLERLAAAGAEAVEPFWVLDRPAEMRAALGRHGLTAPTAHAPFLSDTLEFQGHPVALPAPDLLFEAACDLGTELVLDPMVAPDRWRTPDEVARTAARLNAVAERAATFGLQVGYHNHSFEFHAQIGDRSAYEAFVAQLDERIVLEVDVFWAAAAGQDVPALLRRLGRRVRALHVKDGAATNDPFLHGLDYDPTLLDQRPAGEGQLGVAEILGAAVFRKYDVVEFDHVDGDVFTAIEASIRFLAAARRSTVKVERAFQQE